MRKRLTAAAVAGTVGLGAVGAAVAIPALAGDDRPRAVSTEDRESRLKDALAGLVEDGTLTQEQADKVASTLAQRAPGGRGPGFGRGPGLLGVEGPEALGAAAEALGMSEDDVRSALRDGSTLAELAEKQDKDVDDVVAAIVDAVEKRVATAVEADRLTQEQADRILSSLEQRVRTVVEEGSPLPRHPFRGDDRSGDRSGDGSGERDGVQPTDVPSGV